MRICFVTGGSLSDFSESYPQGTADVICGGFQTLGEVSYERELKGETGLFEDVALLSKERRNVVVCGCFTDARGIRRKSVVVAEKGRILGVSDMVNRIDGAEYRSGAGIKIFDTSAGKLGIVVAEDLYFPQVLQTLSVCGADAAICVFEELNESLEQTIIRAGAFLYGIPICLCAYGYAQAADIGGKVRFASPASPCYYDMQREQEYHVVETRQRGFFRRNKSGF
jgi:predicted amidohydrolase